MGGCRKMGNYILDVEVTEMDTQTRQAGSLADQFFSAVLGDTGVSLNHEATELPKSVRDGIAEMHERWNNRLVWNTLDIAKEYVSGRLVLFVAVDADAGFDLDEASPIGPWSKGNVFTLPSRILGEVDKLDPINASGLDYGRKDGVFLCIVELAKPVDEFPCPVRINCKLDKEVNGRLEGCFYSFARGFEIDPVVPSRKFQVPVPDALVMADKFPCGMIECGAEIVDGIAEDERQRGRKGGIKNDLEKQRAIFMTVDVDSVSVVVGEGLKGSLKVCDVLIGPFNF